MPITGLGKTHHQPIYRRTPPLQADGATSSRLDASHPNATALRNKLALAAPRTKRSRSGLRGRRGGCPFVGFNGKPKGMPPVCRVQFQIGVFLFLGGFKGETKKRKAGVPIGGLKMGGPFSKRTWVFLKMRECGSGTHSVSDKARALSTFPISSRGSKQCWPNRGTSFWLVLKEHQGPLKTGTPKLIAVLGWGAGKVTLEPQVFVLRWP